MYNISRIYLLILVFILFSSSIVHAQRRSGRAGRYRPATSAPMIKSLKQLNRQQNYLNRYKSKQTQIRQSKYSVYESLINNTRTRTTNRARRIVNEFKSKFGFRKMDPKLQAALVKTLSVNREAFDTMQALKDNSSAISTRNRQMTLGEHALRKKIIEAIALSGQYRVSTFLKEAAGTFGTVDAKIVGLQSRVLAEAINRMQVVSPQTRHFYNVLNEAAIRNGIGKKVGNRRQCT